MRLKVHGIRYTGISVDALVDNKFRFIMIRLYNHGYGTYKLSQNKNIIGVRDAYL